MLKGRAMEGFAASRALETWGQGREYQAARPASVPLVARALVHVHEPAAVVPSAALPRAARWHLLVALALQLEHRIVQMGLVEHWPIH